MVLSLTISVHTLAVRVIDESVTFASGVRKRDELMCIKMFFEKIFRITSMWKCLFSCQVDFVFVINHPHLTGLLWKRLFTYQQITCLGYVLRHQIFVHIFGTKTTQEEHHHIIIKDHNIVIFLVISIIILTSWGTHPASRNLYDE